MHVTHAADAETAHCGWSAATGARASLRVLIAAIVLAVASVGTVGFFADRVKAALAQQANLLLGADLMISGDRPLPAAFAEEARTRGLVTSPAIRFNSMVQAADGCAADATAVLTDVKAVAAGLSVARRDLARRSGQPGATRRARHSRARRSLARRAARRSARCAEGNEARGRRSDAHGDGDRRAGSRDRRAYVRAGAEAAAESRRRAGDEPAAAGQPRDVALAGRRAQAR